MINGGEQLSLFEKSSAEKRDEFVAGIFRQLGSHSEAERQQDDFYATDPLAAVLLCEKEKFSPTVWECCVGQGHIAEVLKQQGYEVICSDIVDRGYPNTQIKDFLSVTMLGGRIDMILSQIPLINFVRLLLKKHLIFRQMV